jgi:phosphatidylinositol alpha-mannosyltransferase
MKKKLKIAIVFSSDPSQAGGVQEHIYNLTKELAKLGHKINIFGPENNKIPFINYHPIAKAVKLPVPNGNWSNITIKNNQKYKASQILEKEKFHIIHIHEPYIPFVNWDIFGNTSATKVATFHTAWNNDSILNIINPFLPLLKEIFSSYFKGVIFVSKIVKRRWQYLCKHSVIQKIIHNGIDRTFFRPAKKAKGKIINLLFVGRLVKRKGLIYLLKTLNKIVKDNPNIRLTIVGDGPEKLESEKYVKENNLNKYVRFVGEILGKERINYYQEADIFCAPYIDEAFGITVLEALSCGIPVVGFKNESFLEILKGYPYPELFVDRKNIVKFSKVLKQLINDQQKRKIIGEWGVSRVKDFDWINLAKKTEEFYYQVLGV